jgi:hypothetical protein
MRSAVRASDLSLLTWWYPFSIRVWDLVHQEGWILLAGQLSAMHAIVNSPLLRTHSGKLALQALSAHLVKSPNPLRFSTRDGSKAKLIKQCLQFVINLRFHAHKSFAGSWSGVPQISRSPSW